MAGLQSYEELEANLKEYTEQLEQVEQLLLVDPDNEEMQEMYNDIAEVIQLTKDLLKDAKEQHDIAAAAAALEHPGAAAPAAPAAVLVPPSTSAAAAVTGLPGAGPAAAAAAVPAGTLSQTMITTPPSLNLPSILPKSVADQIRRAQVRSALTGQAPGVWAIGAKVVAQYSADQQWYPGVVQAVTATGNFLVLYDGYGTTEELSLGSLKEREEAEEGYKGVAAPKRKRVDEAPVIEEVPKWLEVKPTDDEKTVAKKRKLLKAHKSKMRFANMDKKQKEKADNWQSFLKGKGAKKKTGFMTSAKRESIFKVPEGVSSKVGVVGSGKGMTDYQRQGRHEFELDE